MSKTEEAILVGVFQAIDFGVLLAVRHFFGFELAVLYGIAVATTHAYLARNRD